MSRQPSAETQLKALRRDYNKKCAELSAAHVGLKAATQEVAVLSLAVKTWEQRHDALIAAIGRKQP